MVINQSHTDPDLALPIGATQLRLVEAVDGKRTIDEIIQLVAGAGSEEQSQLREGRAVFLSGFGSMIRLYWIYQPKEKVQMSEIT